MVKQLSEITDINSENSNLDEQGKDIVLFNLMSGSCSRKCTNCYDKNVKSENMNPEIFSYYLSLVKDVSNNSQNNISSRISTISSRLIEYPYLQNYLL